MIGIYKITNKLNNKSYIGQSIHCGRRLDEHCNGKQLIDEVIRKEGIENFTFEILKEVNKEELSYWEDYYIIKYNTIVPNGYNKKYNCNEDIRKEIILLNNNIINKENNNPNSKKEIIVLTPINNKQNFNLTKKQWLVYYYLLSICNKNNEDKNNYYLNKESLNISTISKLLNLSRTTFYATIKQLLNKELIIDSINYYYIRILEDNIIKVNKEIITVLLNYQTILGVDLIKIYLCLKTIYNKEKEFKFTRKKIIKLLDYNIKDNKLYKEVGKCLELLCSLNLIKLKEEVVESKELGEYIRYCLLEVNNIKI